MYRDKLLLMSFIHITKAYTLLKINIKPVTGIWYGR
jgi:hypothetical protein